jgi:hypothetical protein
VKRRQPTQPEQVPSAGAEPHQVLPGKPDFGGCSHRSRSRVEEGEARQKRKGRGTLGGRAGEVAGVGRALTRARVGKERADG